MPLDLVLVRHGESEGNIANRRSRAGDSSLFTEEYRKRPTSTLRLTEEGRRQAAEAGKWIRANFAGPPYFDRYYVSHYVRAMETAALLDLPDAMWHGEFYLRERERGDIRTLPENERWEQFQESMARYALDPFYWRPPNGESLAELALRVDRVNDTLHRECTDKRVIIVCHGEVMWAERVRLERISPHDFKQHKKSCRIENCQILHYTRRSPSTGEISPHLLWMRSICPWTPDGAKAKWQTIERTRFSNNDLLQVVEKYPRVFAEEQQGAGTK